MRILTWRLLDYLCIWFYVVCLFILFQFLEHTDKFYSGDKLTGLGKKEVLYIANLCAFQFWQRVYKVPTFSFCKTSFGV